MKFSWFVKLYSCTYKLRANMLSTEYYTAKHNIQGRSSRVAPAHPLDSPALPPTAILYCYEKALSMYYYVEDSTYVTCAGEFFSTSYDLDHQ